MTDPSRTLVVVVDDNETGRYAKGRILRQAGFEVVDADTGTEALRIVAERLPRVVLLDVNLPDVNGWEVCRRIKAEEATAGVLVLQISATYTTEADTVRTRCYTGKPARAIRNQYTDEWEAKADQIQPFPMQAGISIQNRVMDYMGVGNTFDATRTFLPAGQSAGLVHEIKPAGQIVRDIIEEAQRVIESRFIEPSLQKQKA